MTPFGELVGTHSIWRQLVLRMRNVTSCTLPGVPCAVRCVTASVSSPYPLLSLVRVRACICTSYVVYACRSKISNPFVSTSITDTKLSTLDPLTRYTMRYSCAIHEINDLQVWPWDYGFEGEGHTRLWRHWEDPGLTTWRRLSNLLCFLSWIRLVEEELQDTTCDGLNLVHHFSNYEVLVHTCLSCSNDKRVDVIFEWRHGPSTDTIDVLYTKAVRHIRNQVSDYCRVCVHCQCLYNHTCCTRRRYSKHLQR